jgi:hypothetical protein
MNEPTFDKDGYPTEDTINKISTWKIANKQDLLDLVDFANRAYHSHYGSWYIIDDYKKLEPFYIEPFKALVVHTGGWSGNEEIIVALEMNHIFWSLASVAQFRGGTYIFTLDVLNT